MSISEKVSYLKGLLDGLNVDMNSESGKIYAAMIDVLEEVNFTVEALEDYTAELTEQVDAIDEDLGALEDELFDDEDGCGCGCGHDHMDDMQFYEIDCPECDEEFRVDEETLLTGQIDCPHCGKSVTLDIEDDEDID